MRETEKGRLLLFARLGFETTQIRKDGRSEVIEVCNMFGLCGDCGIKENVLM